MARKNCRIAIEGIDKHFGREHTQFKMQLSGNSSAWKISPPPWWISAAATSASSTRSIFPRDDARRLMELGFLPGHPVTAGFSAPGGDPRVFQVDGSEIALRRETAKRLTVKLESAQAEALMSDCSSCPAGAGAVLQFPNPTRSGRSPSSALPTAARPPFSIASPDCARKSRTSPASPSSSIPACAELPDGRPIRLIDLPGVYSLTPRSEDEQVALRCPHRTSRRYPQARRHPAGPGCHQSRPPPDARGPDPLSWPPDPGRAEHGRRSAQPRRQGRPRRALGRTRRTRGAHQRPRRRRHRAHPRFPRRRLPKPAPKELPVLQDVPKCRAWAGRVSGHAAYRPPDRSPTWTRRLDALFLHPVAGPAIFLLVVIAVFQTIFTVADPLMDGVRLAVLHVSGSWLAAACRTRSSARC